MLNLNTKTITETGVQRLSQALNVSKNLERFSFWSPESKIGRQGVEAMAKFIEKMNNLRYFDIDFEIVENIQEGSGICGACLLA